MLGPLPPDDHLSMEVLSWLDGPSLVRTSMGSAGYHTAATRIFPRPGCGVVTLQVLLPLTAQAKWPNLTVKYAPRPTLPPASQCITGNSPSAVPTHSCFDDMPICDHILRGLYSYGFEKPSVVQQQAIEPIIQGRDVVIQSISSSGVTSALVIGALHRVNPSEARCQLVVVVPTGDVAAWTLKVIREIAEYLPVQCMDLEAAGHTNRSEAGNHHVVVGCLSSVYAALSSGQLSCEHVRIVVVDDGRYMVARNSPTASSQSTLVTQSIYSPFRVRQPHESTVGISELFQKLPQGTQVCFGALTHCVGSRCDKP